MVSRLSFLKAGFCFHPERVVIGGGSLKPIEFGSSVAVIEHASEGIILFDTGYSTRFIEATRSFPERFYALVTPVNVDASAEAASQLKAKGAKPSDVRHVVLSHLHADHIAGMKDFPKAKYWYMQDGLDAMLALGRVGGVRRGFLRALLPDDMTLRGRPVLERDFVRGDYGLHGFSRGLDMFGDGSLVIVPLPGHMEGHLGLLVHGGTSASGERHLLVGDAAWLGRSFQENKLPNPVTRLLMHDFDRYARTIRDLHELWKREDAPVIVPCHCHTTFQGLPHFSDRPRFDAS